VVACSSQAYQAGSPTRIVVPSPSGDANVSFSTRGVVRATTRPFHVH
jgi:hypothetical protein